MKQSSRDKFFSAKKEIKNIKEIKNEKNSIIQKKDITNKISKEIFYNFLRKTSISRTPKELHDISEYLCQNYNYFTKLKEGNSMNKIESIAKICRLEYVSKGSFLTRFGEICEKFFIVLEGEIEVFKPKFIEIIESPKYILNLLDKIKVEEGNNLKYKRIKDKNPSFFKNFSDEINIKNSINQRKELQKFFIEIDEKVGDYGTDFSYGDITLINKI